MAAMGISLRKVAMLCSHTPARVAIALAMTMTAIVSTANSLCCQLFNGTKNDAKVATAIAMAPHDAGEEMTASTQPYRKPTTAPYNSPR